MTPKEINRQKKLDSYQTEHGKLAAKKRTLKKKLNKVISEISEVNKKMHEVGQAIYDLRNVSGDTPHITDHAIVRYLERVKGLDVWEIKSEIMNHKDSVRVDNTIVTVNGEEDE